MKKFMKYFKHYFRSVKEVWAASKLLTIILFVFIFMQSLAPLLTISSLEYIVNVFAKTPIRFVDLLLPLSVWVATYAFTSISIPFIKNVEGTLSDKLIEYVNVQMMNKSKDIEGIGLFEDAHFYNDIHFIKEQASWRPINLVIFGAGILQYAITIISLAGLLTSYAWWIALVMLIAIVPNSYTSYKIQQEAFESMVEGSEDVREMQYCSDVLLSNEFAKEVRTYHLFDFFIEKYKHKYDMNHQRIMKARFKKMKVSFLFGFFSILISIFVILWFIGRMMAGYILVGGIVAFANSLYYMNDSMSMLIEYSSMLYDTLLYMDKYFNFLHVRDVEHKGKLEMVDSFDVLQFSHIDFCYPNKETYALKDITFDVVKGEKIAIVGENGSGKTTLMKLLCRFYELQHGDILFDRQSINLFEISSYRSKISAVYQDFGKYDLRLRENIALGNLSEIDHDALLVEMIEKAGLTSFFRSNKKDLDLMLGAKFEDAVNLSGGEWQKLAIARALIADRDIVILDEPTASLDPRSEYEIYQKFLELTVNKTVFFITHRLSAVKLSDKVLVLKEGSVHGYDTHENLMKNNPYYKEMYEMQAKGYIID